MKYTFSIPGQPQGKQRPRKTRTLRGLYTPAKTHNYERQVRYLATRKVQLLDKPVKVDITAVFKVPKSYSKKRTKNCLEGLELPSKKPDIDNIVKIILDGMNPEFKLNKALHKRVMTAPGIYLDDTQVVELVTHKKYGLEPRVDVTVEEIQRED